MLDWIKRIKPKTPEDPSAVRAARFGGGNETGQKSPTKREKLMKGESRKDTPPSVSTSPVIAITTEAGKPADVDDVKRRAMEILLGEKIPLTEDERRKLDEKERQRWIGLGQS